MNGSIYPPHPFPGNAPFMPLNGFNYMHPPNPITSTTGNGHSKTFIQPNPITSTTGNGHSKTLIQPNPITSTTGNGHSKTLIQPNPITSTTGNGHSKTLIPPTKSTSGNGQFNTINQPNPTTSTTGNGQSNILNEQASIHDFIYSQQFGHLKLFYNEKGNVLRSYKNKDFYLFEKLGYKDNDPHTPELSKWKKFVWINLFKSFEWIEYDPVSIFDKQLGWLDTFTKNGLVQFLPEDREFYLYRVKSNNSLIFYNRNNGSWFFSNGEMTLSKQFVYDQHLRLPQRQPLNKGYNTLPFSTLEPVKQPVPVLKPAPQPVQEPVLTLDTIPNQPPDFSNQPPECYDLPEQNF